MSTKLRAQDKLEEGEVLQAMHALVASSLRGFQGIYVVQGDDLLALMAEAERARVFSEKVRDLSRSLGGMRSLLENALFESEAVKKMFQFRLEGLRKMGSKGRARIL